MTKHLEEVFRFKVFRLKEVKETDEYLLYNIDTKEYNQYSFKRLLTILIDEIYYKQINLTEYIQGLGIDILKNKLENVLALWIKQEIKLINNLNYKPIDKIIFNDGVKLYFNIYKKSLILSRTDLKQGEYKYIKQLILNLVGNSEPEYIYFIKWIAWQVQNPLKRLPTSIILQGEQGTGKTQFCNRVLRRIFEENFIEIGQTDINADYNDYIMGKQLIVANEVIHNDNKYLIPDKLKNYVTDEHLRIAKKFKDSIVTTNYAQWIFVTNNDIPLKIDNDDRRYSVFKSKKLKNGVELISNLIENIEEEIKSFTYDLLNLDVNYSEVSRPLHNEAKVDLIKANYNSVEEFIDYAKEIGGFDQLNSHYTSNVDFDNDLEIFLKDEDICFITNNLYKLYTKFCSDSGITYKFARSNFTRQMKKYGFKDIYLRLENKTYRALKFNGVTNE